MWAGSPDETWTPEDWEFRGEFLIIIALLEIRLGQLVVLAWFCLRTLFSSAGLG